MSTEDNTAVIRGVMIESGVVQKDLAEAVDAGEQTWTSEELQRDFEVLEFLAPYVTVRRKSDSKLGSLEFAHRPRIYFGFRAHEL